jgi:hypothetical protein
MKNDTEILESLLVGGLVGAALAALISNNKSGIGLGAIAGAVLLASFKANENAKKTNIPLLIEENNALYEQSPDGSKRFIKAIPKYQVEIPANFIIE